MDKALVLINLGSPDSYKTSDVKNYLKEFLMDERVIDYPYVFRKMLVEGIIVPFRAKKSAHAYSTIWSERGSPLKVISEDFTKALAPQIHMPVALAMRYGHPSPAYALQQLERRGAKPTEILVAPMYPHYAMSSYETALEHVKQSIRINYPAAKVRALKPFYNEPAYIQALAHSIQPYLQAAAFDTVLFSYHGLPISHLKKSDPTGSHCYADKSCCETPSEAWRCCYRHQVYATTALVQQKLGIPAGMVQVSFQSRLGSEKWVQPYTDLLLQQLPQSGKKKILVVCPAFVADCLETLEEIKIRGREMFLQNGGTHFEYVPCLNTGAEWVSTFAGYCNGHHSTYQHLWH